MHVGKGSLQSTAVGSCWLPDEPQAFPCLVPPQGLLPLLSHLGFL